MTDKIKFCPQCNSCLFDDMMTCCVCGYQFTQEEQDLVPLSAYADIGLGVTKSAIPVLNSEADSVIEHHGDKSQPMTMRIDCGSCFIDIKVHPK